MLCRIEVDPRMTLQQGCYGGDAIYETSGFSETARRVASRPWRCRPIGLQSCMMPSAIA